VGCVLAVAGAIPPNLIGISGVHIAGMTDGLIAATGALVGTGAGMSED